MGWRKISEAPENGVIVIGTLCKMVDGVLHEVCLGGDLVPREGVKPRHFYPLDEAAVELLSLEYE